MARRFKFNKAYVSRIENEHHVPLRRVRVTRRLRTGPMSATYREGFVPEPHKMRKRTSLSIREVQLARPWLDKGKV